MELTQNPRNADFILSLVPGTLSLENAILASGRSLLAGAVVAAILSAGAATAVGTPTGTGAITVGAAIGRATRPGVYKLVCVTAASNAGTFNYYAPDGSLIRQITVGGGATVSDHLTITIADATDFIVGDTFTIEVTAGEYEALDQDGTDGTQIAAGVLYAAANATDADVAIVVVSRNAELKSDGLTWPAEITEAEQATAVAQLNARGIYLR